MHRMNGLEFLNKGKIKNKQVVKHMFVYHISKLLKRI